MHELGKKIVSRRVIYYELAAFAFTILTIWFDELVDIPGLLLGAEPTPINWKESLLESAIVAVVGWAVIHITRRLFQSMKHLEGILPVCASCKRIRDEEGHWQPIEVYISKRTEADFSHGICPECSRKLYPEYFG